METIVEKLEIPYRRYLDENGVLLRDLPDILSDDALLVSLYERMVFARLFDERLVRLVKDKQLRFHASSLGEEAVDAGCASAIGEEDVLVLPYRRHGLEVLRSGIDENTVEMIARVALYWNGDERGNAFVETSQKDLPRCVTVGLQCTHAVGVALAHKGEEHAVLVALGDGGTSQGDFAEALNAAGVGWLPLVFLVVNNQWAISTPRTVQSRAWTLAQKGAFGGIKRVVQIDGNDCLAVYAEVTRALSRARNNKGPSVIEAVTYRLGAHTTVDNASRYRPLSAVKEAEHFEPLRRMRAFLESRSLWNEKRQGNHELLCREIIDRGISRYQNAPPRRPESIFDHVHRKLPAALLCQHAEVAALGNDGEKYRSSGQSRAVSTCISSSARK